MLLFRELLCLFCWRFLVVWVGRKAQSQDQMSLRYIYTHRFLYCAFLSRRSLCDHLFVCVPYRYTKKVTAQMVYEARYP